MTVSNRQGLVSPSDIAKMASRTPAAVSNWRANKNLGFPEAVGGSTARPLFDAREVTEWLRGRGITVKDDRGFIPAWGVLNAYRDAFSVEEMVEALLAVLCSKALAGRHRGIQAAWDTLRSGTADTVIAAYEEVNQAVQSLDEERLSDLVELPKSVLSAGRGSMLVSDVVRVVDVAEGDALVAIGDGALSRLVSARGRAGGESGLVGSRVSRLLAEVARGFVNAQLIYDPACGIGEALLSVHRALPGADLVGRDINRAAVRVAGQRALIANADIDLRVVDSLLTDPDPQLRADLVVVEPPFGMSWGNVPIQLSDARWRYGLPSKSSSEMLWIQDAVHHLRPGGRAYVITSRGPLFRGGPEKSIRAELLRAGCLEAVVGLPPRMLQHTSIPLALWVLRSPVADGAPGVLIVDGASSEAPEEEITRWLHLVDGEESENAPPFAKVPISHLLAEDAILQPERWTTVEDVNLEKVDTEFKMLAWLLDATRKRHSEFQPEWPVRFSEPRMVSVGSLVDQDVISVSRGTLKPGEDDLDGATPFDRGRTTRSR